MLAAEGSENDVYSTIKGYFLGRETFDALRNRDGHCSTRILLFYFIPKVPSYLRYCTSHHSHNLASKSRPLSSQFPPNAAQCFLQNACYLFFFCRPISEPHTCPILFKYLRLPNLALDMSIGHALHSDQALLGIPAGRLGCTSAPARG